MNYPTNLYRELNQVFPLDMRKNIHLLLISLVIIPSMAIGQATEIGYRNQLKLSASKIINILNPGIDVSYERLHNDKFSTLFSAGVATNIIGRPFNHLRGYNATMEEKYFVSRKNTSAKYFSLLLNYSAIKYQETTSGIDSINNLKIVDTFTIARKSTALAFTYGIQYFKKHFVLDINVGAGLKYRTVKHYDRIFDYDGPREPFDLFRAANVERTGFTLYVPVNIQFGYRF